jgi:hypothetical protein
MAIAASPAIFRVLETLGNVRFEYDVGAGAVQFTHTVGGVLTSGVVADNGEANDLLAVLEADLQAQDPALAAATVTLDATAWRVVIDVGAGNTLRVLGSAVPASACASVSAGSQCLRARRHRAPWCAPVYALRVYRRARG